MELIRIDSTPIAGQTVQTVNARELHAFLGTRKDFSNWIKAQIARARLIENEDYLSFAQKGEQEFQGVKTRIDYAVTIEAGKHIAMMAGTAKGREVRAYFIECERRLRGQDVAVLPAGSADADRRMLLGAVTKIMRREIEVVAGKLTAQNRHLWRALTRPRNAVHLQAVGLVEIGGVYRLAGLEPGGIPAQGKLSGNASRALDAWCKRNGVLVQSASVGTKDVTHWPNDAALAWLAQAGHEMIRKHLIEASGGKVTQLHSV